MRTYITRNSRTEPILGLIYHIIPGLIWAKAQIIRHLVVIVVSNTGSW